MHRGGRRLLLGRRRHRPARRRRRRRPRPADARSRASPARPRSRPAKNFSCARRRRPTAVRCWGDDSVGQLGDGGADGPPRLPALVAGVASVESIAAFWQHACAVTTGGQVLVLGRQQPRPDRRRHARPTRRPPTAPDPASLPPTSRSESRHRLRAHLRARATTACAAGAATGSGQADPAEPTHRGPATARRHRRDRRCGSDRRRGRRAAHLHRARAGRRRPRHLLGRERQRAARRRHADRPTPRRIVGGGRGRFRARSPPTARSTAGATTTSASSRIGGDTVRATPVQVPGLATRGRARRRRRAHLRHRRRHRTARQRPVLLGRERQRPARRRIADRRARAGAHHRRCRRPNIAAGGAHTCAIAADRQLRCWGGGAAGQLGLDRRGSTWSSPSRR